MDRRLAGVTLVMVVIVAAVIIPARSGVRVAGREAIADLPGEPRVGDCLVDRRFSDLPTPGATLLRPEVVGASQDLPRNLVFGPCGSASFGEIAALTTVVSDGASPGCRTDALHYAGLDNPDGRFVPTGLSATAEVEWNFSINLRQTWVMPDRVLRAAGQSWRACVVAPASGRSYAGRLAAAYASGALPDPFGLCWASTDVSAAMKKIDCDRPHRSELIAMGTILDTDVTTPQEVRDACTRAAALVMDRADLAAESGLSVSINPDLREASRPRPSPLGFVCYIASTGRMLSGSVIGLGDRPVPYSG